MKNLTKLFIATLSFFTLSAYAAYAELQKVDNLEKMDVYLDKDSVHKTGDKVTFFLIFDFKSQEEMNGHKFKSIGSSFSGNCRTKEAKQTVFNLYNGNMAGEGMTLSNPSEKPMSFGVPPNLIEKYLGIACSSN